MEDALLPLPPDFVRRLDQLIPQSRRQEVIEGLTSPRHTTLRANTLKIDGPGLYAALSKQNVSLTPVPWSSSAFIVNDTPLRTITELPEYTEGKLYVQSLSSMLPPMILDPKQGEKILDMAAAPGSKTTQMAALMENKGEIVANDTSHVRIYRLAANLKLQGVTNTRVTQMDGRSLWKEYPEYFDKVLVDVPCSMEGRFQTAYPKSFEEWSLKKVRELSLLQHWLLRSAISATKPGGTIVYSTCTLSPEENEEVLDWMLSKDKGVVAVEEIHIPNLILEPAVSSWGGKQLHGVVSNSARVYPSTTMEGFYVVRLRKLKSSVPKVLSGLY